MFQKLYLVLTNLKGCLSPSPLPPSLSPSLPPSLSPSLPLSLSLPLSPSLSLSLPLYFSLSLSISLSLSLFLFLSLSLSLSLPLFPIPPPLFPSYRYVHTKPTLTSTFVLSTVLMTSPTRELGSSSNCNSSRSKRTRKQNSHLLPVIHIHSVHTTST